MMKVCHATRIELISLSSTESTFFFVGPSLLVTSTLRHLPQNEDKTWQYKDITIIILHHFVAQTFLHLEHQTFFISTINYGLEIFRERVWGMLDFFGVI
jgi:hypothetical protein